MATVTMVATAIASEVGAAIPRVAPSPGTRQWKKITSSEINICLNDLNKIIINHDPSEWVDSVSKDLFKWADEVTSWEIDTPPAAPVSQEILEMAKDRIDVLRSKILINPLSIQKNMLEDPILEQNRVWERCMLDDCMSLQGKSPYDNKPLGAVRAHDFAKDILSWLGSLPIAQPKQPLFDRAAWIKECEPEARWQWYRYLAQSAIKRQVGSLLPLAIRSAASSAERSSKEMQHMRETRVAHHKEMLDGKERVQDEKIKLQAQAHEAAQESSQGRADRAEAAAEAEAARGRTHRKEVDAGLDMMHKLHDAFNEGISFAHNRSEKRADELSAKIDAESQVLHQRVDHLEKNHSAQVGMLNGRLDTEAQRKQALEQNLKDTKQRVDSLTRANQQLQANVSTLNQEVADVRSKANKKDKCVIQ